jgi:hypothetical protein
MHVEIAPPLHHVLHHFIAITKDCHFADPSLHTIFNDDQNKTERS